MIQKTNDHEPRFPSSCYDKIELRRYLRHGISIIIIARKMSTKFSVTFRNTLAMVAHSNLNRISPVLWCEMTEAKSESQSLKIGPSASYFPSGNSDLRVAHHPFGMIEGPHLLAPAQVFLV